MKNNNKNKISLKKMDDFIDGILSKEEVLKIERQIKSDPKVKKQYESNINARKMLESYFLTDGETYSKKVETDIDTLFSTILQNKEDVVSFKKNQGQTYKRKSFLSYINITVDKLIPMAAAACFGLILSPYLFNNPDQITSEDTPIIYLKSDNSDNGIVLKNSIITDRILSEKIITFEDDLYTKLAPGAPLKNLILKPDDSFLVNVPMGTPFFMQTVAPMDGDIKIFISKMSSDKPEDTLKGDVLFQQQNVKAGESLIFPKNKDKGILLEDEKGIRVDIEISSKSEVLKFTRYIYSKLQK